MKASDFIFAGTPGKLKLNTTDGEDSGEYLLVLSSDSRKVARERLTYRAEVLKIQDELAEIDSRADSEGNITSTDDKIRKSELIEARRESEYAFAKALCVGASFEYEEEEIDEIVYENCFAITSTAYDPERLKKKP